MISSWKHIGIKLSRPGKSTKITSIGGLYKVPNRSVFGLFKQDKKPEKVEPTKTGN